MQLARPICGGARNQNTGVTNPGYPVNALPEGLTSWTYDPRGLASRQDNPNATHTTLTYDANGQTLQMEHLTNAGSLIDRAWYTYDAAGRPLTKLTGDGTSSYGYDHADRLTSENHPIKGLLTWTYDVAGRRATAQESMGVSTYAYDNADTLLSVTGPSGATSYTADNNGNTTVNQPPTGSPTSYTWDPANRMTKAVLPGGQVHTNTYRHDNMRVKNINPSGTEQFVWDGEGLPDLMFVVGSGGAAGHLAVRGHNLSRMVGAYGSGGSLREQFHLDRQESVTAMSGLYGGTPALDLRNKFNAFGELYNGQLAGVNYAYVGGHGYWHDFDLAMDYVRNRWLENNLGMWLSRDPIGFGGGDWNLGGYVGGKVTVLGDPLGLQPDIWERGSFIPEPLARTNPHIGWNTKKPTLADRTLIAGLRVACWTGPGAVIAWLGRLGSFTAVGIMSVEVLCHWASNAGTKLLFDINTIWKTEPASRQQCTDNLVAAARFTEQTMLRESDKGWIRSQYKGRGSLSSFDWSWAIGGYSAYGQAWATHEFPCYYQMKPFVWTLTDTSLVWQAKANWPMMGNLFYAGLANDFWVDAKYEKYQVTWYKGNYLDLKC